MYQKQPASDPAQNAGKTDIDPKPEYGGFLTRCVFNFIDGSFDVD
jgi:hypothetical protein